MAVLRITRRAVPWPTLLVSALPAAVILTLAFLLSERGWVMGLAQAGFLLLALPAAFVLDEPAAPAVDATPSSPWSVLAARLLVASGLVGLTAVVAWAWAELGDVPQGWIYLLVPTGLVGASLAGAAVLRRWGRVAPGEIVASGVALLIIGMVIFTPEWRGVSSVPGPGEVQARDVVAWLALTVGCLALVTLLAASRGARPAVDT